MLRDEDQIAGCTHGQGFEQDGVEQVEDGGGCANPKGEREDGDARERGAPAKQPYSVPKISGQFLQGPHASGVPARLLVLLETAQRAPRRRAHLRGRQAAPYVLFRQLLDVKLQLVVELLL